MNVKQAQTTLFLVVWVTKVLLFLPADVFLFWLRIPIYFIKKITKVLNILNLIHSRYLNKEMSHPKTHFLFGAISKNSLFSNKIGPKSRFSNFLILAKHQLMRLDEAYIAQNILKYINIAGLGKLSIYKIIIFCMRFRIEAWSNPKWGTSTKYSCRGWSLMGLWGEIDFWDLVLLYVLPKIDPLIPRFYGAIC